MARPLLTGNGFTDEDTERICWLIAHHLTFHDIKDIDHRILVEADSLVNMFESEYSPEKVRTVYERIFRTGTGRKLCRDMFAECFTEDQVP